MPTLAFLLAPSREIPEKTDEEWFKHCTAWNHGTYMAWFDQRDTLPKDRRPRRTWFNSLNLTSNGADYMGVAFRPENKEMYKPPGSIWAVMSKTGRFRKIWS